MRNAPSEAGDVTVRRRRSGARTALRCDDVAAVRRRRCGATAAQRRHDGAAAPRRRNGATTAHWRDDGAATAQRDDNGATTAQRGDNGATTARRLLSGATTARRRDGATLTKTRGVCLGRARRRPLWGRGCGPASQRETRGGHKSPTPPKLAWRGSLDRSPLAASETHAGRCVASAPHVPEWARCALENSQIAPDPEVDSPRGGTGFFVSDDVCTFFGSAPHRVHSWQPRIVRTSTQTPVGVGGKKGPEED